MCNRTRRRPQNRTEKKSLSVSVRYFSNWVQWAVGSQEVKSVKKSPVSTVSPLRFRPPTLQKGLSQKDAERKEGRCRKILQLQKFRKEGERKKFRGSLSAENAEWEGAGGECEERTACQLFGGGTKGGTEGGVEGGRHRDRDCDFLKFAVCCDNNDLGEERDGDADGRRKSFQRMHPPRRRVKRGVLSAIRK